MGQSALRDERKFVWSGALCVLCTRGPCIPKGNPVKIPEPSLGESRLSLLGRRLRQRNRTRRRRW
jgi:hypothetical protein